MSQGMTEEQRRRLEEVLRKAEKVQIYLEDHPHADVSKLSMDEVERYQRYQSPTPSLSQTKQRSYR